MFDLWGPEHSVLREKVLEHAFLVELAKVLLLRLGTPFEVLRSEFDGFGYDVVVEACGVLRHVQLKATRIGGKRASVDIALTLASKPGGCVVWFMVDERTLAIGPFYWLGGPPGGGMPALGDRVTRHTRGEKGERRGFRQVGKGKFARMETMEEVAMALFGDGVDRHVRLLRDHIARRGHALGAGLVPEGLTWEDSAKVAYMVDGYELAEAAGLGDPIRYADNAYAEAERARAWRGSALELWVALFMEHRRDHFGGPVSHVVDDRRVDIEPVERSMREDLCRSLAVALSDRRL